MLINVHGGHRVDPEGFKASLLLLKSLRPQTGEGGYKMPSGERYDAEGLMLQRVVVVVFRRLELLVVACRKSWCLLYISAHELKLDL